MNLGSTIKLRYVHGLLSGPNPYLGNDRGALYMLRINEFQPWKFRTWLIIYPWMYFGTLCLTTSRPYQITPENIHLIELITVELGIQSILSQQNWKGIYSPATDKQHTLSKIQQARIKKMRSYLINPKTLKWYQGRIRICLRQPGQSLMKNV